MADFKENPNFRKNLEKKINDKIDSSLNILQEEISSLAPVDTGKLRDSIQINNLDKRVFTKLEYAKAVEFGYLKGNTFIAPQPYFRPGIENSKIKIIKNFENTI